MRGDGHEVSILIRLGDGDRAGRGPTALGQSLHKIERGRIGPMQVLEREHNRLRSRFSEQPRGQRRQLPAPQLLRRELFRQRDVHQRRDQGHVFGSVETDQPQRVLQIGKASSGWLIRAETLPLFLARFRPHPSPMTNPAPGPLPLSLSPARMRWVPTPNGVGEIHNRHCQRAEPA